MNHPAPPLPKLISDEARAALSRAAPDQVYPPANDLAAWRDYIRLNDARIMEMLSPAFASVPKATASKLGSTRMYDVKPPETSADDKRIYLDFHGGGLVFLGGEACGLMAGMTAARIGAHVISVDYRMPPDHPFPAALDDGVEAYRLLLKDRSPQNIIVGGVSAGGNIAAATVLRARYEGLPMPAALVLMTPELDLSESGDTFETLMGVDSVLKSRLTEPNTLYAGGVSLFDPYVSPLFGDFAKGFPPTFVQSGTRDLFLSNTVLMHRALRKADIIAELHIFEGMPHGGFGSAPEDMELTVELRKFLARHWPK